MAGLFDDDYYSNPFQGFEDRRAQDEADQQYGRSVRQNNQAQDQNQGNKSSGSGGSSKKMDDKDKNRNQQSGNSLSPGGGNNSGGGQGSNNSQGERDSVIYDPSNPVRALRQAMMGRGINPESGNPFIRNMLNYAPGLATAFLGQGLHSGAGQDQQYVGTEFSQFLNKALGQGLGSTLQGFGRGGLMNISNDLQGYRDSVAGGNASSPYGAMLNKMASGAESSSLLASVLAPFMGSMGQYWTQGLGTSADYALSQLDPNNDDQDVFGWLLGKYR